MIKRIGLLLRIFPREQASSSVLQISDLETEHPLITGPCSFVLTLEYERDASYSRGHLRSLESGISFPIQSSAALFEKLNEQLQRAGDTREAQ